MSLLVVEGPTIAAGESLSDGVDCSGGTLVRITCPAEWTNAIATFQLSSDGQFYNDLFDEAGKEVQVSIIPGVAMPIPYKWTKMIAWLKVRSGSRQYPVPQEAERIFAFAVDKFGGDAGDGASGARSGGR